MNERTVRVGDLRQIVAESSSQFKPVMGDGVESNDKKNNDKSYKESEKRAKEESGEKSGAKAPEVKKVEKNDFNRTTLDYNPITEPSKEYKDRVKAQALGYTSKLEQENGIEKAADFEGNKKIYDAFSKQAETIADEKAKMAHSGLQARMRPESDFKKPTLSENVNKPRAKRLTFKRTKLMNESQVLKLIPEQYKVDGQVIEMCDAHDNVYVVECVQSQKSGYVETNIVSHTNNREMNKQMKRIQELMGFETNTNAKYNQINENKEFNNLLDTTRNLNNKN